MHISSRIAIINKNIFAVLHEVVAEVILRTGVLGARFALWALDLEVPGTIPQ